MVEIYERELAFMGTNLIDKVSAFMTCSPPKASTSKYHQIEDSISTYAFWKDNNI
jgi:hypothetical protein